LPTCPQWESEKFEIDQWEVANSNIGQFYFALPVASNGRQAHKSLPFCPKSLKKNLFEVLL